MSSAALVFIPMRAARDKKVNLRTFGGRLKDAARAASIKQNVIAGLFNVTEQAVSQWFRGKSIPERERMFELADRLGVAPEWLATGKGERYSDGAGGGAGRAIPLIDRVQAGRWTEVEENQDGSGGYICVEPTLKLGPDAFALEIRGRSMLPQFSPGDVVVIDPAVEPTPGDFIVAKLEDQGKATFKKYRPKKRGPHGMQEFELLPLNPDWPVQTVGPDNHGRVVGTMVEHRSYRAGRRPSIFPQDYEEE